MIASASQLSELLPLINRQRRVGVDTEADSLHCYREKLCLLQISIPDGDFLVDPLAGEDLEPLTILLQEKEIVLHGADYDLRLLRRALDFRPHRVFDTAIAARLLGIRQFSYAALVEAYFGVQLAKGSQKANWAIRPLSPQMARYARNDTHYLLPLAERLEEQLRKTNRLEWFHQSCERAIASTASDRDRDSADAWRIRGAGAVHGQEGAVLRSLWKWRDGEARRSDRPAFHILRNDQLIVAARSAVNGGMPQFRHLSERKAKEFAAAINQALALDAKDWPERRKGRRERPAEDVQRAAERMRKTRDQAARDLGIEASFIAPRAALDAIALNRDRAEELLVPWQRQLLGL